MPRMTDTEFGEAARMCRALYEYLDKRGADGDEFSSVFLALDALMFSDALPADIRLPRVAALNALGPEYVVVPKTMTHPHV